MAIRFYQAQENSGIVLQVLKVFVSPKIILPQQASVMLQILLIPHFDVENTNKKAQKNVKKLQKAFLLFRVQTTNHGFSARFRVPCISPIRTL